MTKIKYQAVTTYEQNPSYTYPGVLTTTLYQKPKINTPALSDFATIKQGIRSGEYLHLVQPLSTVLTKGTATCEPTYTTAGEITDRKIETGLFDINLSWCKKDFQNILGTPTFLGDSELIGDGLDGYELGGRLRQVIIDEVLEAARLDVWKVLLFGDNSLGTGSTNIYSTIDGVWTKLRDAETAYCAKPVQNNLPNTHNSTLNAGDALTTLRNLWNNAPILLKTQPRNQLVYWVTGSIWDNLYTSYESNQYGTELQFRYMVDGVAQLSFRGIPVIPLWVADYDLENNTNNPWYDEMRHFAILTMPSNHIFGVERTSDLNNIEICYDCKTKTTYIQGEMRFGYNFIHCDLQAFAH